LLFLKMKVDTRQLRNIQRQLASQVSTEDAVTDVKKIVGFDLAFYGDKAICAAVVIDANTLEVLESKTLVEKVPMPYIPSYLAFREGPLILQMYYDLEEDPDVIIVDGHGIAHPLHAGLAVYIGIELDKPTIGVAKRLICGDVQGDNIIFEDKTVGKIVKTKEHANPIYVSPGHKISPETAAELVRRTVMLPHKLPEALYKAHRLAKKTAQRMSMPEAHDHAPAVAAEA